MLLLVVLLSIEIRDVRRDVVSGDLMLSFADCDISVDLRT